MEPLWFIETLLIFSVVYVLWRLVDDRRPARAIEARSFPGNRAIILFGLGLAAVTFLVRLWFPVNESLHALNLQLANFAQYSALFAADLLAYRHDWLQGLPASRGKACLGIGICLILLYPVLGIVTGAAENPEPFMGGWTWQSLTFALFESFICLSLCLGLTYLFRRFWDHQGQVTAILSRNAYGAYLIHEPVITLLALAAAGLAWYPLVKYGLAALVAVPASFAAAVLIRRLPYADRVL